MSKIDWFFKIFRRPKISNEQAIEVAKIECDKRGLVWKPDTEVVLETWSWLVINRPAGKGARSMYRIDKETGGVISVSIGDKKRF